MGQNLTPEEKEIKRKREREREEGRAIETQPKASDSPTSPLDRNAPTGADA